MTPDLLVLPCLADLGADVARQDQRSVLALREQDYPVRLLHHAYRNWLAHAADFPTAMDEVTATTVTVEQIKQHGYDLNPAYYLMINEMAR